MAKDIKNEINEAENTVAGDSPASETVSKKEYDELLRKLEAFEYKDDPGEVRAESERLMTEKTPIRLAYGNDDVFVCVNGKAMLIKRGETVEIPKAYAKVLQNAAEQNEAAKRLIDELSSKADF